VSAGRRSERLKGAEALSQAGMLNQVHGACFVKKALYSTTHRSVVGATSRSRVRDCAAVSD